VFLGSRVPAGDFAVRAARHKEFGFDSVTVHGTRIEEFGAVIAAYKVASGFFIGKDLIE
jgi:hypothetical protein